MRQITRQNIIGLNFSLILMQNQTSRNPVQGREANKSDDQPGGQVRSLPPSK